MNLFSFLGKLTHNSERELLGMRLKLCIDVMQCSVSTKSLIFNYISHNMYTSQGILITNVISFNFNMGNYGCRINQLS